MILEQNDNIIPYIIILILLIGAIIILDKIQNNGIIKPVDEIKMVDPNGSIQ
jgi:hypothetical protein